MIEVDWNNNIEELKENIPIFKPIVLKMKDEKLMFSTDGIFFDHRDRFIINTSSHNIFPEEVIAWSTLEEKQKEEGSRVYLDFSESELEELQKLLNMTQDYIDRNDLQDWKEKEKRVKKFQDKFSKVEF